MESAIFGLVGVVVGAVLTAVLTFLNEWLTEKRKTKKDAEYFVIQASFELERYVSLCASVVADDGLCCGQKDENGLLSRQVDNFILSLKLSDVNWKSIPVYITYELMELKYQTEVAKNEIEYIFSEEFPIDSPEVFKQRQLKYADLGIRASTLSEKLRKLVGLPVKLKGEYNPVCFIKEKITTLSAK